ncbi:hypothetical protein QFZ34_003240 [Phyllobacterium ifriqiyense]|uniref:Uncharacterized protein n=1 Tax=Phyllobacterium ifriqiyense TaxID=314238 RepID=A0ABU0SBB7_9HYPH|nr:hypothetical protein [Phyllobacterium ifriqiyense]MDQ0998058.1 hypothetical protein [Phyllobacterium ifriqiyense]
MSKKDDDKPRLKLVADNNKETVDKNRVMADVGFHLRELTANLLRVSRGAGKANNIGHQCAKLIRALQAYHEEVGHWPPSWDLQEAISKETVYPEGFVLSEDEAERLSHTETMVSGALQIVASRLLDQNTQIRAGESELYRGFNGLVAYRLEQRRAHELTDKARAKPKKSVAKKKRSLK